MTQTYDVIFYRRLPNSYGQEFPVELARYSIGQCEERGDAVNAATGRFKKAMNVGDWQELAHDVAVYATA